MCEPDGRPCRGWKGWRKLPPIGGYAPSGPWQDCSHPLSAEVPRASVFPRPSFEQVMRMPEAPINATRIDMVVHIGTHIDAPRHFFLDGPALDEVPLERLAGRGVVWPVEAGEAEAIEPSHLAGLEERLSPGDILFLNTSWHRFAGTSRYDDDHPVLSRATAEWIVERGVKLLGMDTPTPDQALARRGPDFDYPVHRTLLGQGVLIAEHLTGLDPLNGKSVEIACFGLNIAGGDGSPTRIVAREIAAS